MGDRKTFFSRQAAKEAAIEVEIELSSAVDELADLTEEANRHIRDATLVLMTPSARDKGPWTPDRERANMALMFLRNAKRVLRETKKVVRRVDKAREREAHFIFAEFYSDRGDT